MADARAAHRFVEHVSEVELELEAPSEQELFAEAASAFRELVDGSGVRREELDFEVSLGPASDELLLVEWLDELVFLAEVEAFVPEHVASLELADGRLHAVLAGARGRPRHLVKGTTLHDLELERTRDRWRARVVLDV